MEDGEKFSSTTADGRNTLLIDDFCNAVEYVLQDVKAQQRLESAINSAYVQFLTFAFTGQADPAGTGKVLRSWTKVRAAVKEELVRKHTLRMRSSDPDAALFFGQCEEPYVLLSSFHLFCLVYWSIS